MFKKRGRPTAARQRDENGDEDGENGSVPVAVVANKRKASAVSFPGAAGAEHGRIGASTHRGDASAAALLEDRSTDTAFSGFKASEANAGRPSDDAVRRLETDTEVSRDTRAMHERNQKIHEGLKSGELEGGIYRGLGGYKQYAERGEGAISASKYSGLLGPTRGMSNVRSTMRIEFWASSSGTDGGICKDYKETGYCGFGDSCKFLHDRSDYKSGHLIEKEWEEKQRAIEEKKRKRWEKKLLQSAEVGEDAANDASSDSGSDSDEGPPSACPNCNVRWEDCASIPVQTVCGHYFCEECAMANFAKSPACMTCNAPTNGIFNSCDALEEKIKKRRASKGEARKRQAPLRLVPYNVSLED